MKQEIIDRLDLTETEYKGQLAYKDSNGLIFVPSHSPGLVLVIDSKSEASAMMSEDQLQFIEPVYFAIVNYLTEI